MTLSNQNRSSAGTEPALRHNNIKQRTPRSSVDLHKTHAPSLRCKMQHRSDSCIRNVEVLLEIRDEVKEGAKRMEAWKRHKGNLSSPHAQRCVGQLLRHTGIWKAFDEVLKIPALRDGMRTSTLHKLMALKCDEV